MENVTQPYSGRSKLDLARQRIRTLTQAQKQSAASVEEYFEKWCGQLLEMKFEV